MTHAQTQRPRTIVRRYAHQDLNPRNGWDDSWEKKYPAHTADPKGDPDDDGIDNFTEMLDGTDPTRANKPGEIFVSAEEKARQEAQRLVASQAAQQKWETIQAGLSLIAAGETPAGTAEAAAQAEKAGDDAKMTALKVEVEQREAANMAAAKAALQKAGRAETMVDDAGRPSVLGGMENGLPFFLGSHNVTAAATISANHLLSGGSLGLNLSGEIPGSGGGSGTPIQLGMWEVGDPLTGHQEFLNTAQTATRATDKDGTQTDPNVTADNWHASHVGGTMLARGTVSAAKGMAFKSTLHAYDLVSQFTEMTTVNSNADPSDDLQLSNHSYGRRMGWLQNTASDGVGNYPIWIGPISVSFAEDAYFGYYDSNAQQVDQISFARKTWLPVWSAGNDRLEYPATAPYYNPSLGLYQWAVVNSGGFLVLAQGANPPSSDGGTTGYDTVGSFGLAKNTLTVASVGDLTGGYTTAANVAVSGFSAAGPTDDGRIKPDIAANGESVYSVDSFGTNYYSTASGTSQAAPGVTGSLGLLMEHYKRLYGAAKIPWASTMKGLAIHTADEAGANAGPDYRSGFGLMNAKKAAQLLTADAANGNTPFMKEVTLTNSANISFDVKAEGGSGNPLKVTIVWTDPAAPVGTLALDNSATKLVNDVDLRVIKPDASVASPWVLDPANPTAAATTGDNNKDNVEQIVIDSPVAGATYTVTISKRAGQLL